MPDHADRKLEIVTAVPESAMVVFAHPASGIERQIAALHHMPGFNVPY